MFSFFCYAHIFLPPFLEPLGLVVQQLRLVSCDQKVRSSIYPQLATKSHEIFC